MASLTYGANGIETVSDTYTYDGDGRRVTNTYNGVVTTYVYDPNGQLAMEVGGALRRWRGRCM